MKRYYFFIFLITYDCLELIKYGMAFEWNDLFSFIFVIESVIELNFETMKFVLKYLPYQINV